MLLIDILSNDQLVADLLDAVVNLYEDGGGCIRDAE